MADTEYVIRISDDETSDNDIEILHFRKQTQDLLEKSNTPTIVKKLAEVQCPICFDDVTDAIATSCGHLFCLECILQSLSASRARGQSRGGRGTGLCPLCRKSVSLKETIILKMKITSSINAPELPKETSSEDIIIGQDESSSDEILTTPKKRSRKVSISDDEATEQTPKRLKVSPKSLKKVLENSLIRLENPLESSLQESLGKELNEKKSPNKLRLPEELEE